MHPRFTHWAPAIALALCTVTAHAAGPVKIGFLVKQAEEPWFQDEWKAADQAAKDKGFALVKIGVPNGEKMISAIDNLAAQKAQGFVICAPDVKLGAAVARAARRNNMKVISVDDRLVDGAGKPVAGRVARPGCSVNRAGSCVPGGMACAVHFSEPSGQYAVGQLWKGSPPDSTNAWSFFSAPRGHGTPNVVPVMSAGAPSSHARSTDSGAAAAGAAVAFTPSGTAAAMTPVRKKLRRETIA